MTKENNLLLLTGIFTVLFVVDLIVPDPLPIIDELLLLFASAITGVYTLLESRK